MINPENNVDCYCFFLRILKHKINFFFMYWFLITTNFKVFNFNTILSKKLVTYINKAKINLCII